MKIRLLALVLLAFGVACQKSAPQPAATQAPKPATAAQATSSPAASAASAPVPAARPAGPITEQAPAVKPVPEQLPATLARVNGEPIGKAEFERAVKILEGRLQHPVPAEQRSQVYRGLLDEMIDYKLLLQQSKALRLTVSESELDGNLKQVQARFQSQQEFDKALTDQHVTLEDLKKDLREQIMIAKVIDVKASVTSKELEDFYAKNPDQFKVGEKVHAQHVLIQLPPGADAAAKAKARAEAEAVLKEIRAGADFATVAKQKSQDPGTASTAGDLGSFTKTEMVPEFADAAFKLKPGEVSGVVETRFGFHIIKVLGREPARTVSLEEARTQLTRMLKQQHTTAYVAQLKSTGKIEIYI